MKAISINNFELRSFAAALLLALMLGLSGTAVPVFAHGGEDHGDEKPKTATTVKGTVSRTSRLGDFEITLKHPVFEPDSATAARLFVTEFATNEAVSDVVPTMEIESSSGSVTQVAVEKTDIAGTYVLEVPALGEGSYTIRTNLKSDKGSNTATFSGVEVAHPSAETAAVGTGWLGTALLFLVGAIVLGLFAGLFYFAWRMAGEKQVREETVSA